MATFKMKSDRLDPSHSSKRESCLSVGRLAPFLSSFLAATTILCLFLYFPNPFEAVSRREVQQKGANIIKPPEGNAILSCDLYKGRWIPHRRASHYKNSSCIPHARNCFLNGRKDEDFLHWRWKPDACNLPRFDPKIFLDMVRGNKMAFIGDTVGRNQMESLVCLLYQEEVPILVYEDSADRNQIWHFPEHDFTLMNLWSRFLVAGGQRIINGSLSAAYHLQIDKVDGDWTTNLPTIDYAVISSGHWFFRHIYLYEGNKVVGCVHCEEQNVSKVSPSGAIHMALRTALGYINGCKKCRGIVTVVRTFSPTHFEHGSQDTGGICNRTRPSDERQIIWEEPWNIRKIQVEETEKMRKEGEEHGKSYVAMDVTKAMLMRPDGHPGDYWGNLWDKGFKDCLHWCLPGPIDTWNEFLMAILEIETGLVS